MTLPAPSNPALPAHGIGSRVDRGTRGSTGNRAGAPWLPDGAPAIRVLVAAGAAGVVAAWTLTGSYSGVGWTLAAVAVAVTMPVVGWRPQRAVGAVLPPWVAWAESGWIPLAVALAVVPALLDAEWLSSLCLLAALGAGSLGVVGRRDRSVLRGMLAVPSATVRGIAWAARAVTGRAAGPSQHGPSQHGPSQHGPVAGRAAPARLALSLLAGVGLLAVFAPLMAGADPAFATVLDGLVPRVDAAGVVWWAVRFALGAAVVLAAAVLLAARTGPQLGPARPSPLRSIEWTVPIALLAALFALFVATTLTTLFGSDEHVRATTGLTYAEYARGGFWQLLAVSGLTMVVVVTGLRWTPLRSPGDRLRVRLLLGSLVVLTLVVVASALYRMWLYQQAYGLTVLRLMVAATEVWLAIGFVIMLVSVLRLRPDRPTRGVVAAGMLTLLVLAAVNPERIVAEQNAARWADTGRIDVGYLGGLSADAAPVLATLPEPARSCALTGLAPALDRAATEGWAGTNLSRSRASTLLAGMRPSCSASAYADPSLFPDGYRG